MYLWQKSATRRWLDSNEAILQARADGRLAAIERPGRKRVELEVCCKEAKQARRLRREFDGEIKKLSRDWLKRVSREQKGEPLKIGKRLSILRGSGSRVFSAAGKPPLLVIPSGAAFGTGDHVTTSMSLRLLEEVSRFWGAHAPRVPFSAPRRKILLETKSVAWGAQRSTRGRVRSPESGWSLVDLGTGSGILALAAKRFGANGVIGIDNDRRAIATARENARLNGINAVSFRVGDVRKWKPPRRIDIVTANLFSELLVEILPRLKGADQLILSGILRTQERDVRRQLRLNRIDIVTVRRRGKWIAMLARGNNICRASVSDAVVWAAFHRKALQFKK